MTETHPMFHPLSLLFPAVEGDDFQALVADVAEHGLRQPITMFDGKILDGRTRYLACREAKVEARFETYEGDDPVGYVVSLNIARRHMTESQRAMVAAKIANLRVGRPPNISPIGEVSTSQQDAADMLNVGKRSVERARDVLDLGSPALREAVEKGDVSVYTAATIAKLPRDEQAELLTKFDRREILRAAETIREEQKEENRQQVRSLKEEIHDASERRREHNARTLPPWDFIKWDGDGRVIRSYEDLVHCFVDRRTALGLTQAEVDHIAGFQDGYTGKLEAWQSPNGRCPGPDTWPLWFEALGMTFVPVVLVKGTMAEQAEHVRSDAHRESLQDAAQVGVRARYPNNPRSRVR